MCKIVDVAVYIINECVKREIPVDYFKLQKLAYFSQGLHFKKYGVALAPEDVWNWSCGPGFKEVYDYLKEKDLTSGDITEAIVKNIDLLSFEIETIENAIDQYGKYSVAELQDISKKICKHFSIKEGDIIPSTFIKDYFRD